MHRPGAYLWLSRRRRRRRRRHARRTQSAARDSQNAANAHGGAAAPPRIVGDGALDGGGRHAVRRTQRLHGVRVGEEELANACVIALYGARYGSAAVSVVDGGAAAPVLEEEVGHLTVASSKQQA